MSKANCHLYRGATGISYCVERKVLSLCNPLTLAPPLTAAGGNHSMPVTPTGVTPLGLVPAQMTLPGSPFALQTQPTAFVFPPGKQFLKFVFLFDAYCGTPEVPPLFFCYCSTHIPFILLPPSVQQFSVSSPQLQEDTFNPAAFPRKRKSSDMDLSSCSH